MTKLLELAFEEAKQLSPEEQDELARTIMEIVHGGEEVYVLSEEEEAEIDESVAQLERGEYFTLEEVRERLMKHRS